MNALLSILSEFVTRLARTLDGPLCIALAALMAPLRLTFCAVPVLPAIG